MPNEKPNPTRAVMRGAMFMRLPTAGSGHRTSSHTGSVVNAGTRKQVLVLSEAQRRQLFIAHRLGYAAN